MNDLLILIVILHYVDKNGITHYNIIAVKEVDELHTKENLAYIILKVIK
jgi:hypothetical protein